MGKSLDNFPSTSRDAMYVKFGEPHPSFLTPSPFSLLQPAWPACMNTPSFTAEALSSFFLPPGILFLLHPQTHLIREPLTDHPL